MELEIDETLYNGRRYHLILAERINELIRILKRYEKGSVESRRILELITINRKLLEEWR